MMDMAATLVRDAHDVIIKLPPSQPSVLELPLDTAEYFRLTDRYTNLKLSTLA
jgi:hypothetical protein